MKTEKQKEYQKSWYERNKERAKANNRARYHAKRELCLAQNRKWREENKERFEASRQDWLKRNPLYTTYHNAYRRAKELGLPFDIKTKDIIVPTHCPILGIEFKKGNSREESPSLDRVDPSKGYTKDNIRIISMRANRLKQNGTAEEHRRIADYIDGLI